jgi:hypothetical protein
MCSPFVRREANRFYWIVKGQLIPESWSDKDVEGIYNSYMKRIWGNHENCVHETGFESAWKGREAEILSREIEKVAILGYD